MASSGMDEAKKNKMCGEFLRATTASSWTADTMKLLLAVDGFDANALIGDSPPLYIASENNCQRREQVEIVKLLLAHDGIDVNLMGGHYNKSPPLWIACKRRQTDIVKLLLAHDRMDVNLIGGTGRACSPLFIACKENQADIVKLLVAHDDIDVNVKGSHDNHIGTPLHLACVKGYVELVKLLLEVPGIDILAEGKYRNHSRWVEGNCLDAAATPEIKKLLSEVRIDDAF